MRALIVEDEHNVVNALRDAFQAEGYEVVVQHAGESAFFRVNAETYDVILLDVTRPGQHGLELMTTLREHDAATPVLMLSARDDVADRVRSLDRGADDYLIKPCAVAEVLARVRALLRRSQARADSRLLCVADVHIDRVSRHVTRAGRVVGLTLREFELLEYLARHHGRIVTREMLARDVWKGSARTESLDHVIDVYVAKVRRKIAFGHPVELIHTVRGVGFILRNGKR